MFSPLVIAVIISFIIRVLYPTILYWGFESETEVRRTFTESLCEIILKSI